MKKATKMVLSTVWLHQEEGSFLITTVTSMFSCGLTVET
jgi:hypothetical protein